MPCPFCGEVDVIEYMPAVSNDMLDTWSSKGYSKDEVDYLAEQWEGQFSVTGGMCLECGCEWQVS